MKTITAVMLCASLLAGACTSPPASEDGAVIRAHSERWQDLLNAGDVEALVALYSEDARIMPPGGSVKFGRQAVRDEFGAMIEAGLSGELVSSEARIAGDIGYNVGTYAIRAGDAPLDTGKFVEVWRRGDDGEWRIASDIWNSDAAPAAAAEPRARVLFMHEVDDPMKWLAAWQGENSRERLFAAHGAGHVHVLQSPENPNMTGLFVSLSDPDMFNAWISSDAARAAALEDTVDLDTMIVLQEVSKKGSED